jgi:hypothetical protein
VQQIDNLRYFRGGFDLAERPKESKRVLGGQISGEG